jgi:hypothetical protein
LRDTGVQGRRAIVGLQTIIPSSVIATTTWLRSTLSSSSFPIIILHN